VGATGTRGGFGRIRLADFEANLGSEIGRRRSAFLKFWSAEMASAMKSLSRLIASGGPGKKQKTETTLEEVAIEDGFELKQFTFEEGAIGFEMSGMLEHTSFGIDVAIVKVSEVVPDSQAAKFGVTGLAKVLRAETKSAGVRVCCVYPGATWSPSWSESGVAAERMMPAEDVARAFLEVYRLSRKTVVEEIVLRPQAGDLG
jgi:NAD(P)-dependent dehydrogenase (short-subunit alcohol dehydrogenase family)